MKFALVLFVVIFNRGINAEGGLIKKENGNIETQLPEAEDIHLPQDDSSASAYDLAWQALHAAAAAACRGSTPTGGSGPWVNTVLTRNSRGPKSCFQLCKESVHFTKCDAEVSLYGSAGKATRNGQGVGWFYNYKCDTGFYTYGKSESLARDEEIVAPKGVGAFSFCCCRK